MTDYAAQAFRHLAEAESDIRDRRQQQDGHLTWQQHLELADRYIQLAEIETRPPVPAADEERRS